MSRIEHTKNRLDSIFLRDRAGFDERTVELVSSCLRETLGQFIELDDFDVKFETGKAGKVKVYLQALGVKRRLR